MSRQVVEKSPGKDGNGKAPPGHEHGHSDSPPGQGEPPGAEIARLREELAQRTAELARAQAELAERTRQRDQARDELAARAREASRLSSQLEQAKSRIAELQGPRWGQVAAGAAAGAFVSKLLK